jgi:chemotaxis regulatin CheY-phosphate phosphatase CheZ
VKADTKRRESHESLFSELGYLSQALHQSIADASLDPSSRSRRCCQT